MKTRSISTALDNVLNDFFILQKDIKQVTGLYHTVISEVEAVLIKKTYTLSERNKTLTAKILGISRNTLATKMKILGIIDNESI
ncbi:MAG: hypothetical protein LBE97_01985 [Holosporales bacterium]|jgi:DNA-binding protein Fis|nr:hypothetical protein [Holosporales bacterium]